MVVLTILITAEKREIGLFFDFPGVHIGTTSHRMENTGSNLLLLKDFMDEILQIFQNGSLDYFAYCSEEGDV